ncbi:TetR/AcrR family transcriptional regulator [Nonomuraea roseoviolacea]|uniref:TetR/AcrR family transcriptional repressor of nem operon n=1 Tax=Nonomuraea roseoviolacea subsp. carminata TaxID=160689 RepID=A0ABT1K7Z1_9ACTN|nr:TetR/AcrR family transcriptional regulator [Nonomuraea roseoviolacea]MCP2350113.1 TetR/AcrR family transcriptional repressor of nem operon [Nonomuraea roseoviolacea subsp. carminata]
MPRASRAEAERHREQVIEATARLVRAHGVDKVSVPQAMAAAGLTHGGFYRHFTSKDDLIAQACSAAFAERVTALDDLAEDDAPERPARAVFLATYLSGPHRDNPALGCPCPALAMDAARAEPGDPLRRAFADGLRDLVEAMKPLTASDEATALVELSTIVGALTLSRACAGDDLSDRILAAVRDHLVGGTAEDGTLVGGTAGGGAETA